MFDVFISHVAKRQHQHRKLFISEDIRTTVNGETRRVKARSMQSSRRVYCDQVIVMQMQKKRRNYRHLNRESASTSNIRYASILPPSWLN
ncbi:hypothetical protein D3C86_1701860 [compost metagenome]